MATKLQPYKKYNAVDYDYVKQLPVGWHLLPNIAIFEERIERGHDKEELLSVTIGRGVIKQTEVDIKKDSSNEDKSKYKLIKVGDITYNRMRMWQGALGYSNYQGITSPAYVVLKPKMKIDPKFFHFMFRTTYYTNYSKRFSYGIVDDQLSLRYTDFKRMYSIVPPLEIQNSIVEYLDKKNNEIEKFIRNKERLIELLEEEKREIIRRTTTKGLNKNVELKDSGHKWFGKIPSHWEYKKLKSFADFVLRGSSPTYVKESDLIVISQAAFSSGFIDDTKFKFQANGRIENFKGRLFKDDILLASTGGGVLGKTLIFDRNGNYIADGHATIIRDSKKRFNPYYLFYILQINFDLIDGHLGQGSTNQTELQRGWFKDMQFPFPPIDEQNNIVKFLIDECRTINSTISKSQKEIALIKEYHESLITDLVTGKRSVQQLQTN